MKLLAGHSKAQIGWLLRGHGLAGITTIAAAILTGGTISGNTLSFSSDKPGDVTLTLVPSTDATPSGAQVISGLNATGAAASYTFAPQAVVAGNNSISWDLTGVADGTYKFCVAVAVTGAPPSNVLAPIETVAAPAPSIAFTDAITAGPVNSADMAYTLATTTRDTYVWMTTGGAQDEQRIDTAASTDAMSTATQNALIAAGSFVYVCDIRPSATGTNLIPTFQARGLSGTLYQETVSFNMSTGTWGATPGAFWDHTGFADVSSLYGLAAGSVYRIWMAWTQDGTNTRVLHTANDNLHNTDFRWFCVFDRATFDATNATMDTQIEGLAP